MLPSVAQSLGSMSQVIRGLILRGKIYADPSYKLSFLNLCNLRYTVFKKTGTTNECARRIFLGDKTGSKVVILWPVMFLWVDVFI
jgi:hypothetical protein